MAESAAAATAESSTLVAPVATPPSSGVASATTRRQHDSGLRPAVVIGAVAAVVAGITAAIAPFITPGMVRSFGVPFNPTETLKLQAMLRQLPPVHGLCASGTGTVGLGRTAARRAGKRIVDLGSGDGRIVIAAAQQGHHGVGYEFNFWLVLYSRVAALAAGVSPVSLHLRRVRETVATTVAWRRNHSAGVNTITHVPMETPAGGGCARFVCGNMWRAPIADASCVVIYGVEELMPRFASKLEQELPLPATATAGVAPAAEGETESDLNLTHGTTPVVVLSNTFPLPGSQWEEQLAACEEGVFVYRYRTRGKSQSPG